MSQTNCDFDRPRSLDYDTSITIFDIGQAIDFTAHSVPLNVKLSLALTSKTSSILLYHEYGLHVVVHNAPRKITYQRVF